MTKYILRRLLHGLFSIIVVIGIVMFLIYVCLDRQQVFSGDNKWVKVATNDKTIYEYSKWEEYGYLDFVQYSDFLNDKAASGELDATERTQAAAIGRTPDKDSALASEWVGKFTDYYEGKGYNVVRLNAVMLTSTKLQNGGRQQLFAYKNVNVLVRLWDYFTHIIEVDNIHKASGIADEERGLTFTLFDPVYGGEKFSPAIIGNGTRHKYLLYFDNNFPFIHQNLVRIHLGTSYTVNNGVDVFDTMTNSQGSYVNSTVTYPTGYSEVSADNLHSATYVEGSLALSEFNRTRYTDDYTSVSTNKNGLSKIGYSFVIGVIATVMAYALGLPLGILMARKKDKLADKLGTLYIIFIMAVPSLAYIFMFKALGGVMGLPTTFSFTNMNWTMYILPIVSLALPSIAGLMKWMRRYMIDQGNADYVKFARSSGLSEGEIFNRHIMKNAIIPIVHGIPGSILGALTGAIITERVYVVPGVGNILTTAINKIDNGVIVGVTLFYTLLSVLSIILGDILMSLVDPRISFSNKAR